MNLIKLSATTSTNDYLKKLSSTFPLEDFTVVWAESQTNGKGQMGSQWLVESSKNLTFSVLLKGDYLTLDSFFSMNVMVANAILSALKQYDFKEIYVKWPNDILSYNKKIAGVLIENTIKADGNIQSIVGIGINVAQTFFDNLPQASSILNQYGIEIDKEELLHSIVNELKHRIYSFNSIIEKEWDFYHNHLFGMGQEKQFETPNKDFFSATIQHVNRQGQMVLKLHNNDIRSFNLKEIKLIY